MGKTFSNEEYEEEGRVKNITIELHQPINLANLSPHYIKVPNDNMSRAILLGYAEEQRKKLALSLERNLMRDACDPLQLPDTEFVAHFRLNKIGFQQLLQDLRPHLAVTQRTTAVPNEIKILAVLNFYATGSYQRVVAASFLLNISQPTFSRCLKEVTMALNTREVLSKYIKFPVSLEEREINMQNFMSKFGFPGIIGCIDGTHVALIRPTDHEETYFNRKHYHSLNVLIICDANLNILHTDASFGGAAHDSFVWNQCELKPYLERVQMNGEQCWLLGDSGYANRPWLMTPILGTAPGTPEAHYTELHCRVRNTVERCIGVLKARWRCLLAHRVLHYPPVTVGKIVNACVVLHNIANAQNVSLPELPNSEIDVEQNDTVEQNAPGADHSTRDRLVLRLWNSRTLRT